MDQPSVEVDTPGPVEPGDREPKPWMLALGWFGVLLLTQFSVLTQPPIWDSAMGMWQAADWLAANNFDIPGLLDQPTYLDGGPSTHTLAPLTWITAAAIKFLPSSAVFPTLHLLMFGLAGWAFSLAYRFARGLFGRNLALVVAVAGMTVPVVVVQSTTMYLELPTLAFAMAAVVAWRDGRGRSSVLWLAAAVAMKPNAAGFGLALALATLQGERSPERLRLAGAYLATPVVFVFARSILGESSGIPMSLGFLEPVLRVSLLFLRTAPDILVIFVVGGLMLPLLAAIPRRDEQVAAATVRRHELVIGTSALSLSLTAVVLGFVGNPMLTRYWTMAAPLLVVGLASVIRRIAGERATTFAIGAVIAFSLVNMSGRLYIEDSLNYAVLERSLEFREQLRVDQRVADHVAAIDDTAPVLYPNTEAALLERPAIGYVDIGITTGINVHTSDEWDFTVLDAYPDEFHIVVKYPYFGGRMLFDIATEAESDPGYEVTTETIAEGDRIGRVFHVTRK